MRHTVLTGRWAYLVDLAGNIKELAKICEVSPMTIYRWGTGKARPRPAVMERIEKRLKASLKAESPWK